jgi:hypothetical protein
LYNRFSWCSLALFVSLAMCGRAMADPVTVRHDLKVRLDLKARKLIARDDLLLSQWPSKDITFRISPKSRIKQVTVDGKPVRPLFQSGYLTLYPGHPGRFHPLPVSISYEAVFDDKLPDNPESFDNPGFGVEGTIIEKGVFLLPGSGWYPQLPDGKCFFRITVVAPRRIYAVTAGRLVRHEDQGSESTSVWEIDTPLEGLALSAGPYIIHARLCGSVPVFTYFFPQSDFLSEKYLKAAASHLEFYEKLHGPYPFPKFAVVENFFPTGYGFPSYTLLGTSVLRLPFIPETSLRHEVAHSWWGNGVLVDYSSGNWCEGLTSYVADYLSQEKISSEEAMVYRRQILQDYATLTAAGGDFPLKQFTSRVSPASRAIGYGKAAFVFHMVRQKLGDEVFWRSLRRLFKERLFEKTSWKDIWKIFTQEGHWEAGEAGNLFDQWINRPGAPVIEVKDVKFLRSGRGWSLAGVIGQKAPPYLLELSLRLTTSAGKYDSLISLADLTKSFELKVNEVPRSLAVDPAYNIFRLLYPSEIPATINSIKGAKKLIAVYSGLISPEFKETFKTLLVGLNHGDVPIMTESNVDLQKMKECSLLFFGLPRTETLQKFFTARPEGMVLSPDKFSLAGILSSSDADCLFAVFSHPQDKGNWVALFLPVTGTKEDSILAAARKITHYGQYSYLAFFRGTNRGKGLWEVPSSPLVINLSGKGLAPSR